MLSDKFFWCNIKRVLLLSGMHGEAGLIKALIHLLMKLKLNIKKSIYMLTKFTGDNLKAKPV